MEKLWERLAYIRDDASCSTGRFRDWNRATTAVKGYKASTQFELVTHQLVTR